MFTKIYNISGMVWVVSLTTITVQIIAFGVFSKVIIVIWIISVVVFMSLYITMLWWTDWEIERDSRVLQKKLREK